MKNRFIYLGVISLIVAFASGCSDCNRTRVGHKFDHIFVSNDSDWRTFVTGSDFDDTGLEVYGHCSKCGRNERVDYFLEDNTNLEEGQKSVTIRHEDLTIDYPITVKNKYHIACIGDSLTYGHMWTNQAYPVYLKENVNEKYDVGSFSYNGLSITGYGGSYDDPNQRYIVRNEYKQSLEYKPDIFAIMLGTNDATGWAKAEPTFYDEYCTLLDSYIEAFPNAKFIMMVSPPCINNTFGIPNDVIRDEVNPLQRQLAEEYEFEVLDLREEFEEHENFETDYLRPNDGVHFTVEGAQYVAQRVWEIAKELKF